MARRRIVLVNPPRSARVTAELAPPLGLHTVAEFARENGANCEVVDFNRLLIEEPHLQTDPSSFYRSAVATLLDYDAEIYGLTSMAVDSHVSLELARLLKIADPAIKTIVGGPHFSSIQRDVEQCFPWIDKVVLGRNLSSVSAGDGHGEFLPAGAIGTVSSGRVPFDEGLLASYFRLNRAARVDFEWSRGCKYKCSYCYSSHFHGLPGYSNIDLAVEKLAQLERLGAEEVFFVDDNLLNDWMRTSQLCDAIENASLSLVWHCYATLPDLTVPRLERLAAVGCRSIFMGIDAVGRTASRHFRKNFLHRPDSFLALLKRASELEVTITAAFLLSPPSHAAGKDFEVTVMRALQASAHGACVRLNALTLFNQTPEHRKFGDKSTYDSAFADLMLDVPDMLLENQFARAAPFLFPFHSRYVEQEEWEYFLSITHCLQSLVECFPKTLLALYDAVAISPVVIAASIIDQLPPLRSIEKVSRRAAELALASTHLKRLCGGLSLKATAESETIERVAGRMGRMENNELPRTLVARRAPNGYENIQETHP